MKIKVQVASCKHETKHGVDSYVRFVKKNETVDDIIEEIKNECDYDENAADEYFDSDIEESIIDTNDFEEVKED